MWLIILLIFLLTSIFLYVNRSLKYWDQRNVSNKNSIFSLLGRPQSKVANVYKAFPDQRFAGLYVLLRPTLVIRDPELIKEISVKWFDSFSDHATFASKIADPLWNKNLFALKVEDGWHDARSTVSPSFTSSKLRMMYGLIQKCAEDLTKFFQQGDIVTIEAKDTFTRFTVDVIGTAAFGVTCNSFEEQQNQFYLMGQDIVNFRGIRALKLIAFAIAPTLMRILSIGVFSKQVSNFFKNLVKETIRIREEKQIVRPDMIHLLMEARKGQLKYDHQTNANEGFSVVQESEIVKSQQRHTPKLSDTDITGLALGFFFAGFDTVSSTLSFLAYELGINPDIQEKLYREIDAVLKNNQETIAYETLLRMKYLDMVVSETLRKWPPVSVTNRVTTKPFTIEPKQSGEKALFLESGTVCWIPTQSIHRDPSYYSAPENFDPERFSDENKSSINPSTYLPFGAGPRNCIGSRFALLEIKIAIVETLRKFEIVPVAKTQIPLQLSSTGLGESPKNGIWLGLKPRIFL